MHLFRNDYSELAHPKIMEALIKASTEQNVGYGMDGHCEEARRKIKKAIGRDDVDIHFIPGGTQTNLLAISSFLKPYQAVMAVESGHINVHETGAIEATGHKVLTRPGRDGKLYPEDIVSMLEEHEGEHMVSPAMVYISQSTEWGTIYSKHELNAISNTCKKYGLILFLDGARLGSALCSKDNDISMNDLAHLTDAFYIGGTKNAALLGEAFVIVNPMLKNDFRFMIKQRGAMMAKGFLIGLQFETLFTDDLYIEAATWANKMAELLQTGIKNLGFEFAIETSTNQIFPCFPQELAKQLIQNFGCELTEKRDDIYCIRFVTSFATKEEHVQECLEFIKKQSE